MLKFYLIKQTRKLSIKMKENFIKLENLLRDLGNLYNDQMVITASVLVQNMAFHCENWKDFENYEPYLSILKKMKDFTPSSHILQWAYEEANNIVSYIVMKDSFNLNVKGRQFHIFHAIGENKFKEVEFQEREYVGFVHATSLEEAFKKAQNTNKSWNEQSKCRSTSVGDVIQDNDKFFLVCNQDFKELKK
jgi:hypothetical protein